MSDLILDVRTFEHYSEVEDIAWSLRALQRVRRKYERYIANSLRITFVVVTHELASIYAVAAA